MRTNEFSQLSPKLLELIAKTLDMIALIAYTYISERDVEALQENKGDQEHGKANDLG